MVKITLNFKNIKQSGTKSELPFKSTFYLFNLLRPTICETPNPDIIIHFWGYAAKAMVCGDD